MIPGDLLSAFPHRQFHTLPGLLDSWAALPNSNPNACVPMQGGSLYHFYDGLWYDPAERRTHDLPCERRTRYRLSQPDTVRIMEKIYLNSPHNCFGPDKFLCVCTLPNSLFCLLLAGVGGHHHVAEDAGDDATAASARPATRGRPAASLL